jgi:hypothetical protein
VHALEFIAENGVGVFNATAQERADALLGGNADGSWTPEQQARFGTPNVSQWANNQTTKAQRVLSSNSECGTNVACGAGRVAAVGKAFDALEQQKTLYQDNPARVAQIEGEQRNLLGQLSAKDMEHAALASADADLLLNISGLGAAPAALRSTVGMFQRMGVGTSSAVKTSASEFVAAPGQVVKPSVDGVFATQGLVRDPLTFPEGVQMVNALERKGMSRQEALDAVQSFINSGSTPPVATPLDVTDKLVKVVPTGGAPSANTGYWMREGQLEALKADPANLASKLGLPPGMQVNSFDVYQMAPKKGAVVFESKIAPTTVNGAPNTAGGATQSIVLDRSQFTIPTITGTITIKK